MSGTNGERLDYFSAGIRPIHCARLNFLRRWAY